MSISTCCRIFDAEPRFFRAARGERRSYRFVLPKTKARLAVASLPAATCSLSLRVCKRVRHHRPVSGSRAREKEPLCLPLARTHGISSVLYPSWKDFESAKYYHWPYYWPRLRLCGICCQRRRRTCDSESIREFSGQECWQRLFHSQRQARSWFFSTLAIRRPARRR